MGRLAPRRVFGITLTDDFLKKEPSYTNRDPGDPQDEADEDLDVDYWQTAAHFVANRASSACPCRLAYVETKCGTRPCVVLADTKHLADEFKKKGSESLKKVQDVIGTTKAPHWYWLS